MGNMPDDFLYPVKRATEQVQLAFTFTNLGKAEAYARMADRRVEEIIYMANENDIDEIEMLAASLDSNLNNIAEYSSRKDNADRATTGEGGMMFSEKAVVTEEAEEADMEQSLTVTADEILGSDEDIPAEDIGDDKTSDNQSTPAPTADPIIVQPTKPEVNVEIPPTKITIEPASSKQWFSKREELNVTVINQAYTNIQSLYELLDKVPESTREIILKAIEISEAGYGIAIESLGK
jgi:hypothetical protein